MNNKEILVDFAIIYNTFPIIKPIHENIIGFFVDLLNKKVS
jgi:hypothetical protein